MVVLGAAMLAVHRRGLAAVVRMPFALSTDEEGLPKTAAGAACLWVADKLVAKLLQRMASPFPSSVATIFAVVAALSSVEVVGGRPAAESCLSFLQPGVTWLGKWMLISIAVPCASIPLAVKDGGQWLRLSMLTAGGWLVSMLSTALVTKAFISADQLLPDKPVDAAKPTALNSSAKKEKDAAVQKLATARAATNISAWSAMTALSLICLPAVGPAPLQFCTTILSLLHANRVPAQWVQRGLHPLLVCAATVSGGCALVAASSGITFEASLGSFFTRTKAFGGPGDVLYQHMNAALVALGVRVFSLRYLLLRYLR